MNKVYYRRYITQLIKGLSPEERERRAAVICQQVIDVITEKDPATVLLYMAMHDEVDVTNAIQWCLDNEKIVLLPKICGETMCVYHVTSLAMCYPGAYGIQEPDIHQAELRESGIHMGIIPGRVFDRYGGRIGRGKGYYDRYLAGFPQMYKIGVTFREQCVEKVPMDTYDIPMHQLVVA